MNILMFVAMINAYLTLYKYIRTKVRESKELIRICAICPVSSLVQEGKIIWQNWNVR